MRLTKFALGSVFAFVGLFLILLVGGVLAPKVFADSAWLGLSWGHGLFLTIHLLAVAAAWIHIYRTRAG